MKISCWLFLSQELGSLKDNFEDVLNIEYLERDYENYWEWLHGKSDDGRFLINISRPHNLRRGDYKKPIIIQIESEAEDKQLKTTILTKIKDRFNCEVFHGDISIENENQIQIHSAERF